jgi:hypothetical protein
LGVRANLRFDTPQPTIFFAEFDHGPVRFYFFRNPKAAHEYARVQFNAAGAVPEIWDPWTGRVDPPTQYARDEHGVSLDLNLEP